MGRAVGLEGQTEGNMAGWLVVGGWLRSEAQGYWGRGGAPLQTPAPLMRGGKPTSLRGGEGGVLLSQRRHALRIISCQLRDAARCKRRAWGLQGSAPPLPPGALAKSGPPTSHKKTTKGGSNKGM